jgi:hypothetical protein
MHDMLGVCHFPLEMLQILCTIMYLIETLIHLRYILLNVICTVVLYFTFQFCEESDLSCLTLSTLIVNLNSFHLCFKLLILKLAKKKLLILGAFFHKVHPAGKNYFERN